MRNMVRKTGSFVKKVIFWSRPHLYLGWLRLAMFWFANLLSLSKWIAKQDKKLIFNDFFTFKRVQGKRYQLYEYVIEKMALKDEPVDYIEFGVSAGRSVKWWMEHIHHLQSRFFGFDTFEGLPENWGTYRKGDMNSKIPVIKDERVTFIKGLFQETVPVFFHQQYVNQRRKIIHLDADLFSSTLYVLTAIAPFLKTGDILFFDEFNVPNHEFLAYRMFIESYYIQTKLLGAVNNFTQVAFIIS